MYASDTYSTVNQTLAGTSPYLFKLGFKTRLT